MARIALIGLGAGVLPLTGCVNPYVNNFRYLPGVTPELIAARRADPPPATPEIVEGTNPASDLASQEADGYLPTGYSDFSAAPGFVPRDGALQQGAAIGANRVLVFSQYQGTVNTVIPITTPTSQTTYYNGTATAYGSNGGSATAYGSGTATTYGTQTQYFPISISRYEFLAIYLIKVKLSFGALYKDVTPEQAQEVGTVDALQLTVVVHGTPAAEAGLLPGDIITEVDHAPFGDADDFKSKIQADSGGSASLTIVRDGKTLQKQVALLSGVQHEDASDGESSQRNSDAESVPSGPAPRDAAQGVPSGPFTQQAASIQNVFWHSCGSDPTAEPVSVCQPLSILARKAQSLLNQVQTGTLSQEEAEQQLETARD
ncbi:MAG: PDZ domain-containing protein, partial [Terriglobales bacterium]